MRYKTQYKKLHEKNVFTAWRKNYSEDILLEIKNLVDQTDSKTLLDFGSGTGQQYTIGKINESFGILSENITCYDPGVSQFETLPEEKFDAIISTDVFEHIPEEEVPGAVRYVLTHAKKFAFIIIHCGLAIKKFPDGTNLHVTVKPPEWWNSIFAENNTNNIKLVLKYRIPHNPELNILNL